MRLESKVAIVVGAGQTPGAGLGNGRATAILFARHGAKVLLVDRDEASVRQTRDMIIGEGGHAVVNQADVTQDEACRTMVEAALKEFGRVDILHNNVGIGAGD